MRYVLGVDIGGTSFSIGSVAEEGSLDYERGATHSTWSTARNAS